MGSEYLTKKKARIELPAINKEIGDIRQRLALLEARKVELERAIKT